ncbi:hypothetical protein BJV78DRAFT_496218 [Lactifluus subvellereus]|nr:hypothetical protein BJV78DRAFT_496218 [Lactifluus subvellereus]
MSPTTTTLRQCEIPGGPQSVVVRHYSLAAVAEMEVDFRAALPSEGPYAIGVSVELAPVGLCVIQTMSLALRDHVFCLSLQQPPSPVQSRALQKLFSNILYLAGFELSYTIVLLAHTLDSDVSGYDLSTLTISAKPRDLTTPGDFLNRMNPSVTARLVNERWDGVTRIRDPDSLGMPDPNYALRAWFTAIAANLALSELRLGQHLSTKFVDKPMLRCFVDLATRAIRIDMLKPRIMENDFDQVQRTPDGSLTVENARFKTRIRASHQTRLEVHLANGDIVGARIRGANGRHSSAVAERAFREGISRIRVIGREERTNAQQAQYRFLLFSLTNARDVPLFVNVVWFPENTEAAECDEEIDLSCDHASRILVKLNHSQSNVVAAMASTAPRDSLVIAHGPPGTGKTTTIAAAASIWVNRRLPCWIVAQSNVGVKNIAEKLFKEKVAFKLIVSKDFLFEWYESNSTSRKPSVPTLI